MSEVSQLSRASYNPMIVLASLVSNMLGMALPITMIQIYDRIIPNAGYQTLTVLMFGVLGAIVAEAALRLARGTLLSVAGATFETKMYDEAFRALLEPRGTALTNLAPGELMNRLSSIEKLRNHYCSDSAASLLDLPFIFIFLAMMLAISPPLGLVVGGLVCAVFVIVRFSRRKNLSLNLEQEETDARRQSFIVQTLFGIEFIKSVNIEPLMQRRYERLMSGSARIGAKLGVRTQLNQGLIAVIGLLAPFVTTSVGAYLVINGAMSVGGLAASVLLTGRVIQPVLRIEAYWGGREAIAHSHENLQAILSNQTSDTGANEPLGSIEVLELNDISWRPDPAKKAVLSDISLRLERGDCVALFGGEGSGKSVLLSILSGHRAVTSGEVLINGFPLDCFNHQDLHDRISTLSRENSVLDGTLMENLTGFQGIEYLPHALGLAKKIGIREFIEKHSSGLEMELYSSGKAGLPNAISDSIVIIGGLANQPDVILFDEANSRLDRSMDSNLLDLLHQIRPDVILVVISHRPSYLKLAQRSIHLENGVIVETKSLNQTGSAASVA